MITDNDVAPFLFVCLFVCYVKLAFVKADVTSYLAVSNCVLTHTVYVQRKFWVTTCLAHV